MTKRWFLTFLGIPFWFSCFSQIPDTVFMGKSQSLVHELAEVTVRGYSYDRPLSEVPVAIGYVDGKSLERFNTTSFLPAVNTVPGVRMEERSPGSYRFAIRGSSLRSPFGIRNVKAYWNGLPLTDGGGNTYLNLIDFNALGSIEIIKGPGGSLYGAGNGGVLLLNSPSRKNKQIQFSTSQGSYGLQRYQLSVEGSSNDVSSRFQYSHQQADGYRDQTKMRRDAFNSEYRFKVSEKSSVAVNLLYTDIYYQTPGALNKTELEANRKQARPNAVARQAGVYNKTIYTSILHDYDFNAHWSNHTGFYISKTEFTNPSLFNYEERKEKNWGGRTETYYKVDHEQWKGKLTFGAEFQYFKSPLTDYGNVNGSPDTVQVADRLGSTQTIAFAQAEIDLPLNFFLTVGGSTTFLQYRFARASDVPVTQQTRNFDPVFSPRLALLKKIFSSNGGSFSAYGSGSRGFSPPSLAEVRPSSNTYNNILNAELGTNYEIGLRGRFFETFSFDIAAYSLQLKNAIVIQRTVTGADYYVNSGKVSQPGLETYVAWNPVYDNGGFVTDFKIWNSYTYNPYSFKVYTHDNIDYAGNRLPGVARNTVISGLDIATSPGIYFNVTLNQTNSIPLDDANANFASGYTLLGTRAGYKLLLKKFKFELFGGVDNALDAKYSLGNDLNAKGGRFYNAAPPRNFYIGLKGSIF
jgi:iron complex outermembrane recepter protein